MSRPRRASGLLGLVVLPLVALVVGSFLALMAMVVWPGAFELTAPVLCPDTQQDAFVVRYQTMTSDGTGTNFTLFCMNERGEFSEAGTWRPLGLLSLYLSGALLALVLLVGLLRLLRRGTVSGPPAPGDTLPTGPIVG